MWRFSERKMKEEIEAKRRKLGTQKLLLSSKAHQTWPVAGHRARYHALTISG